MEQELSSYLLKTAELEKILKALSIRRKPDIDDLNLLKKWTKELCFDPENVVFAAKTLKKSSMEKLDELMMELYSAKRFSKEEIAEYSANKRFAYDFAVRFNRALSVYVEVLDTEVDTYVNKWFSYGYVEDALLLIANNLFKEGKNTLRDADETIERLRERGIVDLSSVFDYFEEKKNTDEFLRKILITCGLTRRPTPWDRENLLLWKSWNFTDEMILRAAGLSAGKSSPTAYMNGILSNWKNKGIFSAQDENVSDDVSEEEYNREYARRRTLAVSAAQKNLERARDVEGFTPVYERLFSIEKDLAFAEMENDTAALSSLEEEKVSLTDKANALLSEIGLSFEDLSPRYFCEKCKDTGYVGTHRCDCFDGKTD